MTVGSGNTALQAVTSMADEAEALPAYLKFYLGDHAFAVPLTLLSEVLRPPTIARVPLAPACLIGLANLRGAVLPVLDVRASLNLRSTLSPRARILVLNLGRTVGCLVDRVQGVMDAESEAEVGAHESTGVDKTLLRSVIRQGEQIAFTLDFEALLAREFPQAAAGVLSTRTHTEIVTASAPAEIESDALRLVCFSVATQDYALPITVIQAIIGMPEKVVSIPKAPPSVLGVVSLQNNLLPVFHLRGLLGLAARAPDSHSRIIVVGIAVGGQTQSAGLLVDKVSEVLQVGSESLRQVPTLLGQIPGEAEVTAICHAQADERLFGVLSVQALFAAEQTQNLLRHLHEASASDGKADTPSADEGAETRIVVLRLLDEEFGLPINSVQEIVRVPALAPVPQAPALVAGMMNLHGAVIPVLNPRQRLGMAETASHAAQRILVVSWQGERTGILVDGVSAVLPVRDADFEITPQFVHAHAHLVQRVAHLADGRMLLMLDLARLLDEEAMRALAQSKTATQAPA